MTCSVTVYDVDFEVEYIVNGGNGLFYSNPIDDEIEIESIMADGSDQDLMGVLAYYTTGKVEIAVRDHHIREREE